MPIEIGISTTIGGIAGNTPGGGTPPFSNLHSFSFDGVDDYFLGTSTYSELDAANKLTISFWAKSTNAVLSIPVQVGTGSNRQFYVAIFNTGKITFKKNTNSDNTGLRADSGTPHDGNWNHIMICMDLTASIKGDIFFNGVNVTHSRTLDTNAIETSTGNLYINESNKDFTGKIDELAIWSGTDLRNDVATIYNNGTPTDLNNNGLTAPTTWQRMGDSATWNGATWTMTDVNGGYTNRSINMVEANRTTDVPPNPFVNTLSTYFDGVDDRVEINRTLGSGYAELSVSTWVKYNNNLATSNKYHPIVAKVGPSFGNSFQLANMRSGASSNGGELYFNVQTPNGSFTAFSGVVPSQNVWYNIVGTYDGSNVKIYIDGVLKGTLSASGNINSNTELLMLGDAGYGGYSQFLNGNLDEVSIYSRGLTQGEVTDIFGQGVPSDVSTISDIEAWWRMGDGDTANTITDNVGSNNGTMVNMNASNFVTDVPTFSKKSIALDGVDDFVNVPNSASLQITGALSISFWLYGRNNSTHTGIITKTPNTSSLGSATQYHIQYQNSNRLRFAVTGCDLYAGQETTGTVPTVVAGVWQHITMTWNGTNTMTVYKDGTQVCTKVQSTTIVNNTSPVYLGQRIGWGHLLGKLDEVAIFNTELSQSDVTSIYNGGEPNDLSSLSPLSWWRCGDGDTSPTLTDNGSGGNDGTMTNFTTFSTDVPT